jgi:hypothetical protein
MACCHGHVLAGTRSFHPASPMYLHRPDCCTIGSRQTEPLALLVTSGKSVPRDLRASTSAEPPNVPALRSSGFAQATSPPFMKPVFEKKTDLRI